jgi:hypothetical protein
MKVRAQGALAGWCIARANHPTKDVIVVLIRSRGCSRARPTNLGAPTVAFDDSKWASWKPGEHTWFVHRGACR